MEITSIVLNDFTRDSRVLKENMSFKKAGFSPRIIAVHKNGLKEYEIIKEIPVYRIKLKTKNWPKYTILTVFKYLEFLIKALILTKGCNVVHCNDLETLPIGFAKKLITRKSKIVYDAHELEIHRTTSASPIRIWLNKKIEKWLIKYADAMLTVSDSIADEYKNLYPIERPYIIYNCPHFKNPPEIKNNLFRAKFGIKENQKIFLYQGGFSIGRGIEIMLEAFSSMADKNNVIVFMGYGFFQEEVVEAAKQNENIYYQPAVPIDKINAYSNSADWGLLTIENVSKNNYYCLPNKLFEYIMAEIPLIAFPTIEIKRKIKNYNLGFVTQEESAAALINSIEEASLVDVKEFYPGIKQMKTEFNWENQEKKLINIYNSLF